MKVLNIKSGIKLALVAITLTCASLTGFAQPTGENESGGKDKFEYNLNLGAALFSRNNAFNNPFTTPLFMGRVGLSESITGRLLLDFNSSTDKYEISTDGKTYKEQSSGGASLGLGGQYYISRGLVSPYIGADLLFGFNSLTFKNTKDDRLEDESVSTNTSFGIRPMFGGKIKLIGDKLTMSIEGGVPIVSTTTSTQDKLIAGKSPQNTAKNDTRTTLGISYNYLAVWLGLTF
ncbi:MAG: hypothetical protein SGJ04_02975 [Bacteroidota bacterium]|nr:hypothetical protein [Bacteroidota bacterium]